MEPGENTDQHEQWIPAEGDVETRSLRCSSGSEQMLHIYVTSSPNPSSTLVPVNDGMKLSHRFITVLEVT